MRLLLDQESLVWPSGGRLQPPGEILMNIRPDFGASSRLDSVVLEAVCKGDSAFSSSISEMPSSGGVATGSSGFSVDMSGEVGGSWEFKESTGEGEDCASWSVVEVLDFSLGMGEREWSEGIMKLGE